MNNIQKLQASIIEHYPDAVTNVDAPLRDSGVWSLDVDLADQHLVVEWSHETGFGISSKNAESFGENADERFDSLQEAQRRLEELLSTRTQTTPPLPVLLSRLRERNGVTQRDLAERLGVRQATISGIERRDDIQLSTLRRFVGALGGMVEVRAIFTDTEYRIGNPAISSAAASMRSLRDRTNQMGQRSLIDGAFEGLRRAGTLSHANCIANAISSRHAVIEMP